MKYLIAFFLFSSVAQAACLTSGQCSRETVQGVSCVIVKTGTDVTGNTTCAKQCFAVPLAYECKKNECVLEKEKNPSFDPNSPRACRRAVEI